jgi:PTH1 family peptidyl-tRNA hydrolase
VHVVFGIGNPGAKYEGTRHNLGFEVVEALARGARRSFQPLPGLRAEGCEARIETKPTLLVKPLTYVNLCGPVLQTLRKRHRLPLDRLLAVVDDIALPVGELRLRKQGSDGGHKGLKSLIEHLGTTDFSRLRLGVGDPGSRPAEDYVLERFTAPERPPIDEAVDRAAAAVGLWLRVGPDRAMNEVNRRDLDDAAGEA